RRCGDRRDQRGLRRRAARGRVRHHRGPDRARTGPGAPARRIGGGRQSAFLGDADARRRGALVQGAAPAQAGRRGRSRSVKRPGLWPLAMLLAGGMHTASFAPLGWWPLQIVAVVLLAAGVLGASPRQAAGRGFCFGVAWLSTGLWWLYISMHDYGGMPAP